MRALWVWFLVLVLVSIAPVACGEEKKIPTPIPYRLIFIQPLVDIQGRSDFEGGNEIVRVYHQSDLPP